MITSPKPWFANADLDSSTVEMLSELRAAAGREAQIVTSYNLRHLIGEISFIVVLAGGYAESRGKGGMKVLVRKDGFVNADTRAIVDGLTSIYCTLGRHESGFAVGVRFTLREGAVWVN